MSEMTPSLLCAFRRASLSSFVAQRAIAASVARLYVFVDKASNDQDEELRLETLRQIKKILRRQDQLIEHPTPLGCGAGIQFAITEFLDSEPFGAIFEDDTIPTPGAFEFIDQMLKAHASDDRFFMVTARNELGQYAPRGLKAFASTGGTWGWGTWRRAWSHFKLHISEGDIESGVAQSNTLKRYRQIAPMRFESIIDGIRKVNNLSLDTWDYQWAFTRLANEGLSITPSRNMVWNVGEGVTATHTRVLPPEPSLFMKNEPVRTSSIPREFDAQYLRQTTRIRHSRRHTRILSAVRRRLQQGSL